MTAAVADALTRLHPAWAGQAGVVAVSGGADSVALLRALAELNPPGGFVVAHLNHQLRGDESDGDAAFVRALAGDLGRRFHVEVCAVCELGGNLEAAARRVRYEWLARVAAETGAGWVVTGHTADDQAETVLHRLIRGAGVTGLRGILPVSPLGGGAVLVRPLLSVTRAAVLAYLAGLGQPFRTDSSNADLAFTRNRIRAELLPLLRTFNPAVVGVLGRLAEHADDLAGRVAADTTKLLRDVERPRAGGTVVLDAEAVAAAGDARARELLREIWHRERWPADGMTAAHWRRAAAVALGSHSAADFPGGVHVRRAGKVVQLRRRS